MALLEVNDLSVEIYGQPILEHLSFRIREGETFGLVGETGSGKSVLALTIMGLLPSSAKSTGRISLDGTNLLELPDSEMCKIRGEEIGIVFQEPMLTLNPLRTIGDQVAETVQIHRDCTYAEGQKFARDALDRVELLSAAFPSTLYPHQLSGGQRQRVCIAMAIVSCPRLLIADEPTTALDVSTQAHILKLLENLVREDSMSLLLITHDLAVIAEMAKEITVVRDGRIVETGKPLSLISSTRNDYCRSLIAASLPRPARRSDNRGKCLVEVHDATRDYRIRAAKPFGRSRNVRALDGVTFALNRRESLGLIGASGCGKSTLARTVLGLERLTRGRVEFDGKPVMAGRSTELDIRRRMQAVFQDPYGSFNPRHRVEQLVAEPFYLLARRVRRNERRERVAESLEAVGLKAEDMNKFAHQFSGGQRQRIAIARALLLRPELIVLDEAVSALDVIMRRRILELLANLQEEFGLSYLMISHDLEIVRSVTDRVIVMRDGRIIEQGRTETVLDKPASKYTEKLINASPRIPAAWTDLSASISSVA